MAREKYPYNALKKVLGADAGLSADAVGEWVRLLCVKAGQWQVTGYAGTWTAEG